MTKYSEILRHLIVTLFGAVVGAGPSPSVIVESESKDISDMSDGWKSPVKDIEF